MTRFYDARGNIYGVVSPDVLRRQGIDVALSAVQAAADRASWAPAAIASECGGAVPGRAAF
jgi:diaminopimelate epimerase